MTFKRRLTDNMEKLFPRLKETILKHQKQTMYLLFIMLLFLAGMIAVCNDAGLYKTPVVKIMSDTVPSNSLLSDDSDQEQGYSQTLTGTVLNGRYKGRTIEMHNDYSSSGVFDDSYHKGDKVFVNISGSGGEILTGHISGLKRDQYVLFLLFALFFCILLVTRKKGLLIILSLLINMLVFWLAIRLHNGGADILLLSNIMVILFTALSLLLISGSNKKTYAAIVATMLSVGLTMLFFKIAMSSTDGVDYAFMEYMVSLDDLPQIFMSQILFGGLGATMDIAITMAATISELVSKNSDISFYTLLRSGREVGHDIMGTMINIMLFSYICGGIPLIILKMRNEISLVTIITSHIPFEIYRFLLGSIGILLAIPISLLISLIFFKKIEGPRQLIDYCGKFIKGEYETSRISLMRVFHK